MTAMNDQQRAEAWIDVMRTLLSEFDMGNSTIREAILAAVNYADDWLDMNQADYNTGLPEPFKSTASPQAKSAVLAFVLNRRYGAGI